MSEDVLIKNALFGGFKKEEVLKYIEKIQTAHIAELEKLKQNIFEAEQTKQKVLQLEEQLGSERSRFTALAALNDEYCERIYGLEEQINEQNKKFEDIQDDCNRLKKLESQVGALLLDAVLYSDKMTEKAKKAATSITSDAKQNLVTTAEDVDKLSTEITQISGDFRNDISELLEKVGNLSINLSSFAGRLELDSDIRDEKPNSEQEIFDHFIAQYRNDLNTNENDDESSNAGLNENVDEIAAVNQKETGVPDSNTEVSNNIDKTLTEDYIDEEEPKATAVTLPEVAEATVVSLPEEPKATVVTLPEEEPVTEPLNEERVIEPVNEEVSLIAVTVSGAEKAESIDEPTSSVKTDESIKEDNDETDSNQGEIKDYEVDELIRLFSDDGENSGDTDNGKSDELDNDEKN